MKLEQTSRYQYINCPLMLFSQAWWRGPGKAVWWQMREHTDQCNFSQHYKCLTFWKNKISCFAVFIWDQVIRFRQSVCHPKLFVARPCLFCALRSAIQFHDRVNNTVWFLLSTDCSWNVLWLSGNRLAFRFQHADAREFPSAHLPRQWAGLCVVSPALGITAKLDQGCIPALSAFTANWERH